MAAMFMNIQAIKVDRPTRAEYQPPQEREPDAELLLRNMMRANAAVWAYEYGLKLDPALRDQRRADDREKSHGHDDTQEVA